MRKRFDTYPLLYLSLTRERTVERNKMNQFQQEVWNYYRTHGRHDMPWRQTQDPYRILVSEIMLQQTQVERVLKFYPKFIRAFPDFKSLARAPLKSILKIWQGMGYNRRVLALKKIAQMVITEHHGRFPHDVEALHSLPGIGQATAGAIAAFAFNLPSAFVETNIRRVYLYHFFSYPQTSRFCRSPQTILFGSRSSDRIRQNPQKLLGFAPASRITDQEILRLVNQTLERGNSREWYWALMDYGAMLGKIKSDNPNRRSSAYRRQPRFEGSRRQLRGKVLRLLLKKKNVSKAALKEFSAVLPELLQEGFIRESKGKFSLA